jgi:hypothetical protein
MEKDVRERRFGLDLGLGTCTGVKGKRFEQ